MTQPDSMPAKSVPDYAIEQALKAKGAQYIAGIDEAGRGPLAGPVVAAAVVLNPTRAPDGLNDSKKLSAKKRDSLFDVIMATSRVSIAVAPPSIIDQLNIRGATLWAMREAAFGLVPYANHALIDGKDIPDGLPCPASFVIGGDAKSISIAAASIVAKVTRDRMCPIMDLDYPGFSFDRHKGYGTAVHMAALAGLGPTPHHRASFAPVMAAAKR